VHPGGLKKHQTGYEECEVEIHCWPDGERPAGLMEASSLSGWLRAEGRRSTGGSSHGAAPLAVGKCHGWAAPSFPFVFAGEVPGHPRLFLRLLKGMEEYSSGMLLPERIPPRYVTILLLSLRRPLYSYRLQCLPTRPMETQNMLSKYKSTYRVRAPQSNC